ncbi:MAG TPA: DNA gyrase subunit A [Gemmatimonadota bacterium]|nr:DNA gyrase subunit A [Gemmatimonadota bacterium]
MAVEQGREQRILERQIVDEMKESFIDYSMSVIVARALPDVRDGLKPVHRRILYSMSEIGLGPGRPYKKSATVVGDVLGKYHPHGDTAVYDAMVRMVQPFSLRYPLVDGQGNFGSIDGDSAAAYRYTEARMAPIAAELLADIDKDTVDYVPNYDDRLQEPSVLPARIPNLLVNGASGIAVGMATNIPPHNLREIVSGLVALIDDPELDLPALRKHIKGPDFPTGGYIYGTAGIQDAYETGRGKVIMRARASTEIKDNGRERIVITEIPYQVNKTRVIEQIAELVRSKKITDISDLRDESDRDGMRMVIELKSTAQNAEVVLNQLYSHTQLQQTFGIINLALVDNVPKEMPLKEMLERFLEHRHEVVVRRSNFELRQAEERLHIVEGLRIAVDNIDEVVALIRKSGDTDAARTGLMERFDLSERQAQAILDMRLARLTSLERDKLEEEYRDLLKTIAGLQELLGSKRLRMEKIKEELREIAQKYGDERRTEIQAGGADISMEDLIAEEDMVVTISHTGYIKRIAASTYRRQRRGGRGVTGMGTKEDDWIERLYVASTHDYLLVLTEQGKCHWLKVYDIPQGGRASRGRPIVNVLETDANDQVADVLPVREFDDQHYLITATQQGQVKKTVMSAYSNPRRGGIIGMKLESGDRVIGAALTDGTNDIMLATRKGQAIRFSEDEVRDMGRDTMGVRGITLQGKNDGVLDMVVVKNESNALLAVTENGYGKRTLISDYRVTHRGGKGIKTLNPTAKTGPLVAVKEVVEQDELMIVTTGGIIIRLPIQGIRIMGRATQGVRLINLEDGHKVGDVARVVLEEEEEGAPSEGMEDAALLDSEQLELPSEEE